MKNQRGSVDPLTLIVILVCFGVGGYFALRSKIIDSPTEQTAEAILRSEGIDIDFSAKKKRELNAQSVPQVPRAPD